MILGIMQPYFFPYLGYFDLIFNSDRWVVFDTPAYSRKSWMNRNRILKPQGGWQYVTMPVNKAPLGTPIHEIRIHSGLDWRARILGQLAHYERFAPYFQNTMAMVKHCLDSGETRLSRLNVYLLETVCAYIGISFEYEYYSEMDLDPGKIDGPGDWALGISSALGADTYINPPGGEAIFDRARFERAGIELEIRNIPAMEYPCGPLQHEPNLSVIDALMWNSPEQLLGHLQKHRLAGTNLQRSGAPARAG